MLLKIVVLVFFVNSASACFSSLAFAVARFGDESQLKLFDQPQNNLQYLDALRSCWRGHGNLINIEFQDSNEILYKFLAKNGHRDGDRFWGGASDALKEGEWISAANAQALPYLNWLPGRPDKSSGNLNNCLEVVMKDGKIYGNDINCLEKRSFICEYPEQ